MLLTSLQSLVVFNSWGSTQQYMYSLYSPFRRYSVRFKFYCFETIEFEADTVSGKWAIASDKLWSVFPCDSEEEEFYGSGKSSK